MKLTMLKACFFSYDLSHSESTFHAEPVSRTLQSPTRLVLGINPLSNSSENQRAAASKQQIMSLSRKYSKFTINRPISSFDASTLAGPRTALPNAVVGSLWPT